MFVSDFNYHRPESVEEACRLLARSQDGIVLAGGTDLLVDLKLGKRRPRDVVSLTRIRELGSIDLEDHTIRIGASVTHNRLIASPAVRDCCPALAEAAATIGTEQIRNTATVGGNLCTASSCMDTAPILIALGAKVELHGSRRKRTVPLSEFFTGHRTTVRKSGEILTYILLPLPRKGTGAAYRKFGLRQAANISVASVAAVVRLADGRCEDACIVMGAVAPTPKIARKASELVKGQSRSDLSMERVGEAAAAEAEPIDDIRGSAAFRRELTAVLTRRALAAALDRASRDLR